MKDLWIGERQTNGKKILYRVTKMLARRKSSYQDIVILQTSEYGRILILDDKIMLSEAEEFPYHEMLTHVPILSITTPVHKVLIIGGGDGGTARECLKHKSISNIDVCEIDKHVVDLSKRYLSSGKFLKNKRVNIIIEDGLKYLDRTPQSSYEVVLVDGTDPVGEGKVLFSKSFFQKVKKTLSPGGALCIQSETPFTYHGSILSKVKNRLSALFKYVRFYGASVPMYPSGYWLFAIASDNKICLNTKRYSHVFHQIKCKYYNAEIHNASFQLPEFSKKIIYGKK